MKKDEQDKYKYFAEDDEKTFHQKIIEMASITYSLKMIIVLYIISKIINLFNEKFIAWIILNILLFYGPIEKRYPFFLFRCRMFIQQIFEGVIGIFRCFIPTYEPKKIDE